MTIMSYYEFKTFRECLTTEHLKKLTKQNVSSKTNKTDKTVD